MVSVIMITFGHEKYIEEAIKGIFIQQTSFPVELIIANDCSPDHTDEVVKELLKIAPSNIVVRYTRHDQNKGMNVNFIWALEQVSGKYIALCEGDDYWTDPLKLQKQVDLLEKNVGVSLICGGNTVLLPDGKRVKKQMFDVTGKNFIFDIMVFQNKINTHVQTLMFRNMPEIITRFSKLVNPKDFSLFFLALQYGSGIYVNEIWSVYRMHETGVWSLKSKLSNLKWEYEESKSLFSFNENKKFIRVRYFFNALSYLDFKENTTSKTNKISIALHLLPLIRNRSEFFQLLHSLFLILTK